MQRLLLAISALYLFCPSVARAADDASAGASTTAAASSASTEAAAGQAGSRPEGEDGGWGIDLSLMDSSIEPGDDFYRYVNEGWLETTQIPQGLAGSDAFVEVYLRTEAQINELVTDLLAADQQPGTTEQQVADLLRSYSDVERRNALGMEPVRADLDAAMAIETHEDAARLMARPNYGAVISGGIMPDPGNPRRYVTALGQGDLTMPDRDYYLSDEGEYPAQREAYLAYIAGVFDRAGIDDGEERARQVLALETAMAEPQWTATEQRNPVRMYHLMSPEELAAFAPGFDFAAFYEEGGFPEVEEINVNTDTAVQALAALFAQTPIETLRSYLAFTVLDNWAPLLSEDWEQAHFGFHSTAIQGVAQQRPIRQRALVTVSQYLGEDLGRLYVARYFPAERREALNRMIGYVRAGFRERIENNDWMDEPTRAEALNKVDGVVSHIGYPERWHDHSGIRIAADDLVGNVRRITAWNMADGIAKLGEERRDWEWPYTPQTINAGYLPSANSVTFPAAILQPPFFDPDGDIAFNFGAIAAVIGHELGHAFDDQGSRSDALGRLRDWWTAEARADFNARTAILVEQFNGFSPIEDGHVNGALTLGENIGDLSGLTVAYGAYRAYVREELGGEAPVLDGFTGDQRFFMAWAQLWRNLMTPEEVRRRLVTDPHSPGEFRVNGAVRNVDGWYDAFNVTPDDALYLPPEERVRIW